MNRRPALRRMAKLIAFFLFEIIVVAVLWQGLANFECQLTGSEGVCLFLRSLPARALALLAVWTVILLARPGILTRFFVTAADPAGERAKWVHFAGVALLLLPLFVGLGQDLSPWFRGLAACWLTGALLASLGGLCWIAPARAWGAALRPVLPALILITLPAFFAPEITMVFQQLWTGDATLTLVTFYLVSILVHLLNGAVLSDPSALVIGAGDFFVRIAPECSGVEGLALVGGFLLLYAGLFRDQIRALPYWLVVVPLALLASFVLNILRIAGLVLIGINGNPTLAVEGFHSYAGWLFFTILALLLIWAAQSLPWLRKTAAPRAKGEGLRSDWLAARMLPFIAFMVISALVMAAFAHPELGYPLKALVMAAALLFFLPALRSQDWRPAGLPLLAGLAVGLGWWLGSQDSDTAGEALLAQLIALPAPILGLWILCRAAGTILLVPVIEELLFRGYLQPRLSLRGPVGALIGLVLTSLLFGLLHGRVLAGFLSGLVFGALYLWRGRISDPVWAHITANALIAVIALITRDVGLI
ncbi:exosortase E/protease, VPEID-CTERM system [Falsigemmobacter faecalis]|uniref:Exosortase E/protease, VPEID-CTERM system n=1 Tax=Falsigemmobacter faecalis TaxID=2488730 RepID=A0A3P3DNL2_9RHOB|nr:exosortase E/protease, VPEID-CTERM system [Falsigemmobacter faecalis]RRH75534.1 exosortase E/protease, VPEID-CTERM system [Falsigemmobacter faecalis]